MLEITDSDLRAALTTALAVPRFVDEVAARAPFAGVGELLASARDAATPLAPSEIDEAMAHHPRIGEKPVGEGAAQSFSRAEQSAPDAEDVELAAALAEGNRAYEQRFDRVFLIRAAGRSRAEVLSELNRRLQLDDATELAIVGEQLREIALLRLEATFGAAVAGTSAADSTAGASA